MEITPALTMPNGLKAPAFELKNDGSVYLMCDDNVIRRVHPKVVHALGTGAIAPGVWTLACQYMQNPAAAALVRPWGRG